jgi:hypothetical protein
METDTLAERPPRTLPLLGCCETIQLPMLPNYLRRARADSGSVSLADLTPDDVTRLGMAYVRALREHWRQRFIQTKRLSVAEARAVDVPPPYTRATVDAIAARAGVDAVTVDAVLARYHEDLSR